MQTFVALMRGINVGSTRKLPMVALRDECLRLGLKRPETYIQSGNLIVDAELDANSLRTLLERKLSARFGFTVDIVVRLAEQWEQTVMVNPFANDVDTLTKAVHLYLSREPLAPNAARTLERLAQGGERIHVAGGALWIAYGDAGVARSKLTPKVIDTACGSPTTGRNWNSVLRISEMIQARA